MWSPAPPSSALPSHRAEVTLPARHQETSLEPIATHIRGMDSLEVDFRPQFSCRKTYRGWSRNQCLPGEGVWVGSGHREWWCGGSTYQPLSQQGLSAVLLVFWVCTVFQFTPLLCSPLTPPIRPPGRSPSHSLLKPPLTLSPIYCCLIIYETVSVPHQHSS